MIGSTCVHGQSYGESPGAVSMRPRMLIGSLTVVLPSNPAAAIHGSVQYNLTANDRGAGWKPGQELYKVLGVILNLASSSFRMMPGRCCPAALRGELPADAWQRSCKYPAPHKEGRR